MVLNTLVVSFLPQSESVGLKGLTNFWYTITDAQTCCEQDKVINNACSTSLTVAAV